LILRIVLVLHTLALFLQSGIAGEFLSGTDNVVKVHEAAGWVLLALGLSQTVLAAFAARSGGATLWLVIGSLLVLFAEGLQVGTGFGRFLRVHIPLAMVIFGAVLAQTISQFRQK
jgi:hypothetical protein